MTFETATPSWSRSISAVVSILIQVACRVAGAAAAVLLSLMMARSMNLDEMGLATSAMSVGVLGALIASVGMEAGGIRFLPGYLAHGETARARGFLRFGVGLAGALGIGFGALALCVILTLVDPARRWPYALAVAAAALIGLARVLASQSLGFRRPLAASIPMQLVRPTALLALTGLAVLGLGAPSATAVMVAFALSVLLTIGLQIALTLPLHRRVADARPDYSPWREWLGVGVQLGMGALFLEFGRDLAIFTASFALSAAEVAIYGVAIRIIGFVKFGVVAVNQNYLPALSAAMARDERAKMERIIAISNHLKFWPVLACCIGLVFLGPWILALFGPEFEAARPLLLILMGEPLLMAALGPAAAVLSFSKHYTLIQISTLFATLLLVAAVFLGGRYGGMTGAAWGVIGAWGAWCLLLTVLVKRRLGLDVTILGSIRWSLARARAKL